jgi:hypothetical protein
MPSAAKVWKRRVRGSYLHARVLSRFARVGRSRPATPSLPSDIRRARDEAETEAKRKRGGLISFPSTITSDRSTEYLSGDENHPDLTIQELGISVPEKAVLVLNASSGFLEEANNP